MSNHFNQNWRFFQGEMQGAGEPSFDDTTWREINLPHDSAIDGPFSLDNDRQVMETKDDKTVTLIGQTGGLPVDKPAWYRRKFQVSEGTSRIFLEFDGIMSCSTIYVNGQICGGRRSGYSSFSLDVTRACQVGLNILAVHISPESSSSRWYTGSGIYRNVRLIEKKESFFPYMAGVVTAEVKGSEVHIFSRIKVENPQGCQVLCSVMNPEGKVLQRMKTGEISEEFSHIFRLNGFVKWNLLDSYLYTLKAVLYKNNVVIDEYETTFGIRLVEFHADKGFFLNGKKVKLKGVCLHHDLGALGVAFSKSAAKRQLEKLIDIGVNAVRCVHNPVAPEFLDACDELGVLVIDEIFDEWSLQKMPNSFGKHFQYEAEKDLRDSIHRDRNHPSVILWSLGNEMLEERQENGWIWAKFLSDIAHKEDPTRLVTAGFAHPEEAFHHGLCDFIDVVGLNYCGTSYEELHRKHPNTVFYASETTRSVSSRGEYEAKSNVPAYVLQKKGNLQINSNDFQYIEKGCYPEREFLLQEKHYFLCGEFVWTGFDYLGDPQPYSSEWPTRSSFCGIFDSIGLPKDRAFSYKSRWTEDEVMHLFPHWNWEEGERITMQCYSNFEEVELFVNDISQGISVKLPDDEILSHRHIWNDVLFVSGEVKAVAVRKPSAQMKIKTASEPIRLRLFPEKTELLADGESLVYIKCAVLDENDVICPNASYKVDFSVTGAGEYVASDNGDPTDTWIFSKPYCKTFHGLCMAIVRSKQGEVGEIVLTVTSDYLLNDSCTVFATEI